MLDDLKEGVIVLEEKSKDILYYNAAAAGAQVDKQLQSLSTQAPEVRPKRKAMVMKIVEKRFAPIDKSIF